MSKNLSELAGKKSSERNLFEDLGIEATKNGTPESEAMKVLSEEYLFGKASVFGTVSFYDFLRPENKGKKVYICNGSSCLTAGTQDTLRAKLKTQFSDEEIGEMCCLGRCHENSSFNYLGKNFSGDAINNFTKSDTFFNVVPDRYQVKASGTDLLISPIESLNEWYGLLLECLKSSPEALLQEIKLSGIRGRGGAGFPMAFKLDACRLAESTKKYIVCNADEGDPGAYSDRYLLEQQPHKLLLGMLLTGYITGAQYGIVYIRGEYPESIDKIQEALNWLMANNWIGEHIQGSTFSFQFKVIKAQGAYICGEETALLSSIEGQRPEVRVRPPYPTQAGLFNKPTVVNNVETLANIPYILKQGGAKFASIGTVKSTGTKLISLDGFFNNPGIYEVEMGTSLSVVVNILGGGFKSPVKAMHIGGPLGGLVPVSMIEKLTIDYESFSAAGFLLGHASIVCIPEPFPLIEYLEHLFRFTAHESCGKCFPCRLGSTRGAELIAKARTGDYVIDRSLMNDLLETLETGSLCALGGGLPLPVKNAMHYFESELSSYFK